MNNNENRIRKEEKCAEQIVETKNENAELEKQAMESSSMNNKNAADEEIENMEQKSIKKSRIRFHGWLPDMLDWFKRPELAQTSLPTSALSFHQHCYRRLHGNEVKPRIVPQLTIVGMRDHADNWQTILFKRGYIEFPIPIADVEPPEYIIGFDGIHFGGFINDRILKFVKNILPLFKEDLRIYSQLNKIHFLQIGSISRMMEMLAPKIDELDFIPTFFNELNKFNQQFPNFIPGLQSIYLRQVCNVTEMNLALKWLSTPREDGKSKMLAISTANNNLFHHESNAIITKLIERVKEEFIQSTEPAKFIISFTGIIYVMSDLNLEDFKIENTTTKEMLELQRERTNKYLLIRHKNDSETKTVVGYKPLILFM